MADEEKQVGEQKPPEPKKAVDEKALQDQLQKAMASGDMQTVIKIAGELKKAQQEAERAEMDAKKGQIAELEKSVTAAIEKVIEKFGPQIVDLVGKERAVLNVSWKAADEAAPEVKVVKGTGGGGKKGGGGGGTPQKFDMSSEDLLDLYGDQEYKEGEGKTLREAWDENTEKNHRFNIRKKLIKLHTSS